MSVSDTAVAARPQPGPLVRDAVPADYPAIREVVIAAYRQYADLLALDIFSPYLADVLDLEKHARYGRLIVVEVDGWICGFGAFYPDTTVQDVGFPAGWAGGRALAVHPAARGHGVARARVSSSAYYLGRPAALWIAAFAPRPADRESCTSESSPHGA
jgi:GNAT superfamily N-acetyltransferase